MLLHIHPKLPMRNKHATLDFYVNQLEFQPFGGDYPDYLMVEKDGIQVHFFAFPTLDPEENYGQVYIRTDHIDEWYAWVKNKQIKCSLLETQPWGQKEFSILDPDHNLLTFGQSYNP